MVVFVEKNSSNSLAKEDEREEEYSPLLLETSRMANISSLYIKGKQVELV